jgi:uncharacterized protein (TIGR02594 family)
MRGVLTVAAVVGIVAGSLTLANRLDPVLRKWAPNIGPIVGQRQAQRTPAPQATVTPSPSTSPSTPSTSPEADTPPRAPDATQRGAPRQRASRDQVERNSRNLRRRDAGTADAAAAAVGGLGAYQIVAEARRHIGTNPTAMARLWCARFMNHVLARSGYRGTNSDAAMSFARYGRRVPGPRIGAIAVMRRKGGGHVGIVSGVDRHGNPILISGNNGRHGVAETVYPRRRIIAYVMPWR